MSIHTRDLLLKQLSHQPESCSSSKVLEEFFQVISIYAYVYIVTGLHNILLFSCLQEFSITMSSVSEKIYSNLLMLPEMYNSLWSHYKIFQNNLIILMALLALFCYIKIFF